MWTEIIPSDDNPVFYPDPPKEDSEGWQLKAVVLKLELELNPASVISDFIKAASLVYIKGTIMPNRDKNAQKMLSIMSDFFNCGFTCGIWKFSGLGSNTSHSCNLYHSCGNTGFFTQCTTAGTPMSDILIRT